MLAENTREAVQNRPTPPPPMLDDHAVGNVIQSFRVDSASPQKRNMLCFSAPPRQESQMKNRRPWIVGPFAFIPLTQGYVATVDLVDLPVVGGYRWYAAKAGTRTYAVRVERTAGQKQRTIMMHRALHKTPDGFDTDHKDRNGLHNCRTNLRTATPAQNQYNRLRQVNNSSGVKGVSWHRVDKKWQARIKENGKYRFLGYFDTIEAAAAAREVAAKSLHGEFYRG